MTAIIQGAMYFNERENLPLLSGLIGIIAVAAGASILAGFLVPVFAPIILIGSLLTMFSIIQPPPFNLLESTLTAIYVNITTIALVLIGPGAFSFDARLFGRREIIIPANKLPPDQ